MPKTDIRCWSCGNNTMIEFEQVARGWLKCSKCGATSMPSPTRLHQQELIIESAGTSRSDSKYRPRAKRTPKAKARAS